MPIATEDPATEDSVPALRIRSANTIEARQDAAWVVYWMTAFRRTRANFALQRARDIAIELDKPLLIFEPIRVRYRWASDRFHRFIICGMRDNQAACEDRNVLYYPYVEPKPGAGSGLLHALAKQAAVVVTDDYPCFFHPNMIKAVAKSLPCRLELVDSNGLIPLSAADRTFTVAHSYRRWMQKEIPKHLESFPETEPLKSKLLSKLPSLKSLPKEVLRSWPEADLADFIDGQGLAKIPIDHSVSGGAAQGGACEAHDLLNKFVHQRLKRYSEDRNEPDQLGSSELSPHLHFGHISAHEVFAKVMEAEQWNPSKLKTPNGKMNGYWNVSEDSEAFLDQLCTWREIGYNMCWREPNYQRLGSLADWTQKTMGEHVDDERPYVYSLEQFERAETHDEIWNAAQRQLVREGRIHNYLRMLWGKKILHWTRNYQDALDIMIELNNKYALDGRDPNSYSGIFWVLGRYDRAWGPERPIFGKIRYMTSENTAKKHKLGKYLQRFARFEK